MLPKNRFPLGPGGVRPSAVATSSPSVCSFPMIGASGSYDLFTTSLRIREPPPTCAGQLGRSSTISVAMRLWPSGLGCGQPGRSCCSSVLRWSRPVDTIRAFRQYREASTPSR